MKVHGGPYLHDDFLKAQRVAARFTQPFMHAIDLMKRRRDGFVLPIIRVAGKPSDRVVLEAPPGIYDSVEQFRIDIELHCAATINDKLLVVTMDGSSTELTGALKPTEIYRSVADKRFIGIYDPKNARLCETCQH